jgi:hypothetical protein
MEKKELYGLDGLIDEQLCYGFHIENEGGETL